jgi:hypothetical protein
MRKCCQAFGFQRVFFFAAAFFDRTSALLAAALVWTLLDGVLRRDSKL